MGFSPIQALYHCRVMDEYLPACCCEMEEPARPSPQEPSCCEDPGDGLDRGVEIVEPSECDCCDVIFTGGRSELLARPASPSEQVDCCPVRLALPLLAAAPPRAFRWPTAGPSPRGPPWRPLYLLLQSYLC
jgi:hypothetical protein